MAIELVDSVEKTLTEHHSGQYFHQKVWLCALKDAEDNKLNVEVSSTQEKRRSAVASHLIYHYVCCFMLFMWCRYLKCTTFHQMNIPWPSWPTATIILPDIFTGN